MEEPFLIAISAVKLIFDILTMQLLVVHASSITSLLAVHVCV